MESERYKREVTISKDMQWVDFKMDKLYWEIKNLQDMRTPGSLGMQEDEEGTKL